jgi:Flp pilus assembly pilin Flp
MKRFSRSQSKRYLRRLNARGAAFVEFALIAPLFIVIMFSVFQLGMIGWAKSSLETALRDAARFALTGAKGTAATRADSIIAGIKDRMSMFQIQDGEEIQVASKVYPTFEDIGQPEKIIVDNGVIGTCEPGDQYIDFNLNGSRDTDMAKPGYGGPNDVTLYSVTYPMQALLPLNLDDFNLGTIFTLTAKAAVQNEPFGTNLPAPVEVCS